MGIHRPPHRPLSRRLVPPSRSVGLVVLAAVVTSCARQGPPERPIVPEQPTDISPVAVPPTRPAVQPETLAVAPAPIARDTTVPAVPTAVQSDVRVCAGGDVMLGNNLDTLWAVRRGVPSLPDPGRLLGPLRALVSGAAIVLFNIEGAIGDGPAPAKCREGARNCYAFRQPVGIAGALRAFAEPAEMVGNVANNHSMDAGETGFRETLRYLAEAAVHTIGADTLPTIVVSGADSVAFLGFAATRAGPDPRDLAAVRRHVSRAKALTPRVIVSVHMGAEGTKAQRTRDVIESHLGENRGNPIAFAHAAVDAGASVVIGHGPHVLRGAEWYRGSLVLYSLGNLLTYGVFSLAEPLNRGAIACVVLAPDGGIAQASLHPTRQVPPGIAAPDASGRAAVLIDSLGQLDFPDSGARVRGDSLLLPGVMGGPERGGHVRRDGRLQGRP